MSKSKQDTINALNALAMGASATAGVGGEAYDKELMRILEDARLQAYYGASPQVPATKTKKQLKARKKSKAAKASRKKNRK